MQELSECRVWAKYSWRTKPAGEHSLALEGGWLGLEFAVATEILMKGD